MFLKPLKIVTLAGLLCVHAVAVVRTIKIEVDDKMRSYELYMQDNQHSGEPVGVVIMLHGGGGRATSAMRVTRWNEKAEKEGFAVVYPEGTRPSPEKPASFSRNPQTWNDGSRRLHIGAVRKNIDDIAFLAGLIDSLRSRDDIDSSRIYVTGFSNGASMAFRVARELSGRIAAVAPVAGADWLQEKIPARKVPVMYITGTNDPLNPIKGGPVKMGQKYYGEKAPVKQIIDAWTKLHGCAAEPVIEHRENATLYSYSPEAAETAAFVYCEIEGHGHIWPGGISLLPGSMGGSNTSKIDATDLIWDFFKKHKLPEQAAKSAD
ncbi:MAG: PHB depolymerase family esterase [Phycisphaerae bacterium]